ncbi:porphobilinogen deaminase isoform X2 [Dendroctonus ponderosae]|nr:porphobilinogen deaminase isoform X2 [Dendroctonus ponderosae]
MTTLGDQILDIPLPKIGEKSLFTKELESALSAGLVDFIVHSLKDLPTSLPNGMAIGATLSRENPRDALVLQKDIKHHTLATLPEGSVIGTSSLRRTAQLAKKYPHLKVENIRGNLNTRLKKLDDLGKYHAIILASAGLNRIGWTNRISKMLNADDFLYAVGQGAIAVECRANDEKTIKLLEPLYDLQTALRVIAERSFLKTLGGGCSAPVAVTSDLKMIEEKQVQIALKGAVWSLDGAEEIVDEVVGVLPVLSKIRCAECPYINGDNEIKDIECCAVCPMKTSPTEPLPKKKRIEVPSELFNDDPHEKCPVAMPIGSDFMGECPFLQGDIKDFVGHPPLNGATVETLKSGFNVCPVLKNLKAVAALRKSTETPVINGNGDKIGDNNEHLFVGLVGHKDASPSSLRKAVELGESLAKKLIEKGALAVMTEAQNTVHSQISQVVAQC